MWFAEEQLCLLLVHTIVNCRYKKNKVPGCENVIFKTFITKYSFRASLEITKNKN